MPDLTGPLREIIEGHRAVRRSGASQESCSCGADGLSDHSGHVAEQILDRLGLKPEAVDGAKKRIRYATAWLDWELTKMEGAQC
ncbi:hypothetical protein [Mycobacterium sp. E787]|uniref:hypothetical protein n=1 Tax=Mycobacterium sp. E787 TaxID=1834150 RepID=UPI0007FE6962|nr:hypothetical protein [Mycobacterium sp. E787]OBI54514.1 hypothetical protein A5705_25975 [Mycobacterium sp. E787]